MPTTSAETLVANNSVMSTSEPFFEWILNGSFGNVGNTTLQVPQGTIGMAVAVYQNHGSKVFRPPYEAAYDPWWWIKTWWGRGPDPAPDSIRQFGAVLQLVDAASRVAPQARGAALEAALQQLRVVTANLEKEIKGQQQKQL